MIELNFSPFPVIETNRLLLRRITLHDAEDIFALRTNKEVRKHLDKDPPSSVEEIRNFILKIDAQINANELITWAMTKKEEGKFIGQISFHRITKEHHRAEIGYLLMHEYWRQGFTDEAVKALIDFGFSKMKLHSIEAQTNPNNEASIQLLLKNGFVQEAYFRENYFYKGKFMDTPVFSLVNKNDSYK